GQAEQSHARPAARERRHQRMLVVGQGPVFLRRPQFSRSAQAADDESRWPVEGNGLANGARARGRGNQGGWERRRRPGYAAFNARRAVPDAKARARPGQPESGFPPAPGGLFRRRQTWWDSLAWDAGGGTRQPRSRPRGGLV